MVVDQGGWVMGSKPDGRLGGSPDDPDHGDVEEGEEEDGQQEEDQEGDLVHGVPLQYVLRWVISSYQR